MIGRILLCWLIICASSALGGATLDSVQSGFLGGQVSPLLSARPDSPSYKMGCRAVTNMQVVDVGAATRRPGSVFVATAPGAARLEPFVYSDEDAYVLEFTEGTLRFYRDTGIILDANDDPYDVNTVFASQDLFRLQTVQSADVMEIVDGRHIPQQLQRYAHASWVIEDVNFTRGPFRVQNTDHSLTVEANAVTGDATLIATGDIFDANQIGALWRLDHVMPTQAQSGTFSSATASTSVIAGITAPYYFSFTATAFRGSVQMQVSYDEGATWTALWTATNATSTTMDVNDAGISDFGQNVLLRLACNSFTSGSVDYELSVDSYTHVGVVRLTGYTDANEVEVAVLDRIGQADSPTSWWSEGAWSDYRGWPTAVTRHFNRTVYARDLTFWFSSVLDGTDFSNYFNADDEAFTWKISQTTQNPVRWLLGDRTQNILAGTLGKVMELRSLDELAGFTPTNPPKVASAAFVPCARVSPITTESSVLFLDRTGRHLHELLYDSGQDAIMAPDLTYLAGEILGSGAVQLAYQRTPYPTVWAVRSDGQMASCYYHRLFSVAAWSTHTSGGDDPYTSVAVVPTSSSDRVWTVVCRNGTDYDVEYLAPMDLDAELEDAYFVDSGLSWDGGAAVTISAIVSGKPPVLTLASWPSALTDGVNVWVASAAGMTELNDRAYIADDCNETALTLTLDSTAATDWDTTDYDAYTGSGTLQVVENAFGGLTHLEGREVAILADGVYAGTETVASGAITLDEYANTVAIGLNYTSVLSPIEVDMITETGSTRLALKRIGGLLVQLYDSNGGRYGPSSSALRSLPYAGNTGLYTGPLTCDFQAGANRSATYTLVQTEPLPFTVLGTTTIWEAR